MERGEEDNERKRTIYGTEGSFAASLYEQYMTEGTTIFPGGDYAESIRRLCQDTNTPCIDMTELTRK